MRLTKFVHSCLLVEDGDARVLVDPGHFSHGFESLRGLTGILVTHSHVDHLDVDRMGPLLAANPDATLLADVDSAAQLRERGIAVTTVHEGERHDVGLVVEVVGHAHAQVHPDIATPTNHGYLFGQRLFHPGDALTVPEVDVEVLALPAVAPWSKVGEVIDYLRLVAPGTALPIHEAVYAHPEVAYGRLDRLKPEGTTWTVIDTDPLTL